MFGLSDPMAQDSHPEIYRKSGHPVGVASLWTRSGKDFIRTPLFDARVPNLDEFNAKVEFSF